jgi:hypothetical protein
VFERFEVEHIYYIGTLPGLGNEFERREVFERSEFERAKFNCNYIYIINGMYNNKILNFLPIPR